MKYISEFRDGNAARMLAEQIAREARADRHYRFMEFCGGHTHTIFRYGIPDLLPSNIHMLHGPGCPVCVLPMKRIDAAIDLALHKRVVLCTYGDMLRVPGAHRMSLQKAKGQGADIRMIYSPADALSIAEKEPQRDIVFFAVGFETTTPPTAVVLSQAAELNLSNFSVFCNHVLTPPAVRGILEPAKKPAKSAKKAGQKILDGLIGPGHVSVVIGSEPYQSLVEDYQLPIVITGFEPIDILQSILMSVRQVNASVAVLENQYTRAVKKPGNEKALALIEACFELRDSFEWRGLGWLPHSALKIKQRYSALDAEKRFAIVESGGKDNKACECPSVLRGMIKPTDCLLFGKQCTPENPIGSCMVSSEGACAAYFTYRRGQAPVRKAVRGVVM